MWLEHIKVNRSCFSVFQIKILKNDALLKLQFNLFGLFLLSYSAFSFFFLLGYCSDRMYSHIKFRSRIQKKIIMIIIFFLFLKTTHKYNNTI
jgi:hypothetical protein